MRRSTSTTAASDWERVLDDHDAIVGRIQAGARWSRAVADAAFALKAGEVSAPVQGRFGIAIVKADAVEASKARAFEEVSAELKRDMAAERAKNEITTVQEKIEDERLGGSSLADAARKFKLQPRLIEAIDRNGKDAQGNAIPDLPQNVDVLSAAFGAEDSPSRTGKRDVAAVVTATMLPSASRRAGRAGRTTLKNAPVS